MRLLTLTIFIIPLLSCTILNQRIVTIEQYSINYIDSKFDPIIRSFVYEAGIHGHNVNLKNLSVIFANIKINKKDKTVGYCIKSPIGGMVIKIHKATWSNMDIYKQEELVFHELAHCLMGRNHCDKKTSKGPLSIMNTHLSSGDYYKENREVLLDELFNINSKCIRNNVNFNEINR